MTWLSRLLPKSDGFPRRASDEYRIRSRRGPGRRRMMSLEGLEGRTLLTTNLTATYDFATLSLTIVGDTNDDSFKITEGSLVSGGRVTITPTGATPPTINDKLGPYTTTFAVRNIVVTLPGTSNNDTVVLTGAGKNVSTPVVNVTITATGPNLSFNANNVQNYGTLSVQCTGGSLTAQVDQGRFASLAIAQTGAAPASVEVGGDIIPGRVSVMEGGADGDTISLNLQNGDRYGPIHLAQGTDGSGTGNNDHISVIGASGASAPGATALVSDLTIQQSVNGAANSILVDTVSVLASSFGLRITQGSGEGNTTTINNITSPSPTPPSNTTPNGSPGISVVQGDGSQDQISVTNSFANPSSIPGGTVSLAQGAGDSDKIIVQGDIFGSTQLTQGTSGSPSTPGGPGTPGGTPGGPPVGSGSGSGGLLVNGNNDSISVSSTRVADLTITQNVPVGTNDAISLDNVGLGLTSFGLRITQGSGDGNTTTINNVTSPPVSDLSQYLPSGPPGISVVQGDGSGDQVTVTNSSLGGALTIGQGNGSKDVITVDSVVVGQSASGVAASQGDGIADKITINNVTSPVASDPAAYIVYGGPPNIIVTQGTGANQDGQDSASVTNSSLPGWGVILIIQNDGGTHNP